MDSYLINALIQRGDQEICVDNFNGRRLHDVRRAIPDGCNPLGRRIDSLRESKSLRVSE